MQLAYRAASLPDAQIIADLLRADGIETRMFNQNAQSAAGEIPPAVAGPQVWVVDDEQLERARRLIAAFQAAPQPGTRPCPRCGEENPANFLTCWSCGGAF
jgi:hypothetical protein